MKRWEKKGRKGASLICKKYVSVQGLARSSMRKKEKGEHKFYSIFVAIVHISLSSLLCLSIILHWFTAESRKTIMDVPIELCISAKYVAYYWLFFDLLCLYLLLLSTLYIQLLVSQGLQDIYDASHGSLRVVFGHVCGSIALLLSHRRRTKKSSHDCCTETCR